MRIWLATAASQGCRFAKTLAGLLALTLWGASAAMAQPTEGGEAGLKLPDLSSVSFLNNAIDGHKLLLIGILFCLFGLGLWHGHLHASEESAGSPRHARDLRTHLRNLQDVPDHAGQIHTPSVGIHCGHHRRVLRMALARSR